MKTKSSKKKRITPKRRKTKNPDLTDELQTKKKEGLHIYPYFIIAAVMLVLIAGSSLLFNFLPDFKDKITIESVAEQKTVYSDESLTFFGLDMDTGAVKKILSQDETDAFCSRISRIVTAYDENAAPEESAVFGDSLEVYDTSDTQQDSGEQDGTADDAVAENTAEVPNAIEVSGGLYVLEDCVYTAGDNKNYTLSVVADDSTIYLFKLDEVHDSELSSREFYQVLNGLDLDVWKTTSAAMKTGYDEVMYSYNNGGIYYYNIAYNLQPYVDELDKNELSEFYEKINNLVYPDENYADLCSCEKLSMPQFFGKIIENTALVSETCLDGSSIIIYSSDSVLGEYHLGYVYDLYTGQIIGFGLCK